MEKQQKPHLTLNDFEGDLDIGDQGADVKKMQQVLLYFASKYDYEISPDLQKEINSGTYGQATNDLAEKIRQKAVESPRDFTKDKDDEQLLKLILQYVFHIDMDELDDKFARGKHGRVHKYRTLSENNETRKMEIGALQAGALQGHPTSSPAANLALQFVGQREEPGNRGPLVALFGVPQGMPWCGGFVDYAINHTYGKVYQENPLAALSYQHEASKVGAFHKKGSDYEPVPGDVMVFGRNGGGHVGLVTGVRDGKIYFVEGNASNSVRESYIEQDKMPTSFHGFAETAKVALSKNIHIEAGTGAGDYIAANARRHSEKSVSRG